MASIPWCAAPAASRPRSVIPPGSFAGMVAKVKSARQRRRLGLLVELAGLPFKVLAPTDRLEKVA
jgi:hypothetical protein